MQECTLLPFKAALQCLQKWAQFTMRCFRCGLGLMTELASVSVFALSVYEIEAALPMLPCPLHCNPGTVVLVHLICVHKTVHTLPHVLFMWVILPFDEDLKIEGAQVMGIQVVFRTSDLKLAGRIIEVYDNLAPQTSRKRKDKKGGQRNAWADYNKCNAINMEDNVICHLSRPLQTEARSLGYSPRERLKWLVTETVKMSTSLSLNIFVKFDSVRPDVMKCLIVGPDDTPYAGGLFEWVRPCWYFSGATTDLV